MANPGEHYEMSWILHHILDRFIGSQEIVAAKRKIILVNEKALHISCDQRKITVQTGSYAEGMFMEGSDSDMMHVDENVIVLCPDQNFSFPPGSTNKTVFMMTSDAGSRPGYVTLELLNQGQTYQSRYEQSIVEFGGKLFLSSEMLNQSFAEWFGAFQHNNMTTHGPAATTSLSSADKTVDCDTVWSLPCSFWPSEANEWLSRPRLHEWPDRALRDEIVQDGCYLVPVGDKTSPDSFLQWRISFATAERKLIYSLTHTQCLIYGLLKYFLKQISERLDQEVGEADIVSSYIIKTVMFYAVENTHSSFWQEKHSFSCFIFCLNILIAWVKAGHCPNYFINSNNMFLGKVRGETQQNLLRILIAFHNMKWECLSFGTFIKPSIGMRIQHVLNGQWKYVLPTKTESECEFDVTVFKGTLLNGSSYGFDSLRWFLALLLESWSDIDEFIAYLGASHALSWRGLDAFERHVAAKGNKEKYKYLKKCKKFLVPLSSVCTSPGQLLMATYYYQTGNYRKTLELCEHMISSFKIFVGGNLSPRDRDRYQHFYCGHGYTLLHKCKEVFVSYVLFELNYLNFCPFHLHQELKKYRLRESLDIPPLPYAVFLTFICYHELGDTRRRHEALRHLRAVKYDKQQGGNANWIVHNLLGICYEMIGDKDSALREYTDSLNSLGQYKFRNPAIERIERLQHFTFR